MTFKDFLEESKKISGIKGTLGRYDDFSGSLQTIIWVQDAPEGMEDETTYYTSINFDGATWELKSFSIGDAVSQSKLKRETKKAIESMLKKEYQDYFTQDEDDESWAVTKGAEFEIELPKEVLK